LEMLVMLVGTSGIWSLLSGRFTPTFWTQEPPAGHCVRVQEYHVC
jgi:hypothetical protein